MFGFIKKSICAAALLQVCLSISISASAAQMQNALPVVTRVDEIIEGALYKYVEDYDRDDLEEQSNAANEYAGNLNGIFSQGLIYNFDYDYNSFVTRADALECIIKVIGQVDDQVPGRWESVGMRSLDLYDAYHYGSVYAENYIWSAANMTQEYRVTEYKPNDKTGCKGCLTLIDADNREEYIYSIRTDTAR